MFFSVLKVNAKAKGFPPGDYPPDAYVPARPERRMISRSPFPISGKGYSTFSREPGAA
jgi:hypothetical protein